MLKGYRDESIEASSLKIVQWFCLDQFEPERAVTSHFVSSKTLFLIRLPLTLYSLIVMWVDIIWSIKTGEFRHFFAYFTDLTFIGLHAYLITTLYHHAKYLWPEENDYTTLRRPSTFLDQSSILNYMYVYLYHTVIVFNIQTPVVFWALLAKERLFNAHLSQIDFWISISLHAVTLFILSVEVVFNRMLVMKRMVFLVFGTVVLYMCLTFIIFAAEQWWVYSFLDWRIGPSVTIWYLSISIFIVICFFIQVLLHKLRDWIAKRLSSRKRRQTQNLKTAAVYDPNSNTTEKNVEINQTSNFEPLASTIGGASRITFGDSFIDMPATNESSIYY